MKLFITILFTLSSAFSVFAQRQAEVIVTSTYLRQSPDITSEKVQTVQKGEKVIFEKSRDTNGWYYVSISNGQIKGWIRRDTIGAAVKVEKAQETPRAIASIPQPVKQTPQKTVQTPTPVVSAKPIESAPTAASSPPPTSSTETETAVEDDEVVRVDTEEVSLNVRVVDGNNRLVSNLNQSHFKVYEDDVLQPITSLTTAEVPVINALVIDNSRSLRSQLKTIIEAEKIIVGANRPNDESAVVRFVSSDKIEVVQDFTPRKSSLDNALDNLFVEGGQTAIIDAVYQTAKKVEEYQNSQKKEDIKLRSLILVSDGDDRGSVRDEQQLFKLLRESQVQIYAIGFINALNKVPDESGINRQEKAKAFLTRLARETGGKVYFPNSIDELPLIASEISGELRTQYLISYAPTNEVRDGAFRKIKVEIAEGANKEKRIAVTRTGRNSLPK